LDLLGRFSREGNFAAEIVNSLVDTFSLGGFINKFFEIFRVGLNSDDAAVFSVCIFKQFAHGVAVICAKIKIIFVLVYRKNIGIYLAFVGFAISQITYLSAYFIKQHIFKNLFALLVGK